MKKIIVLLSVIALGNLASAKSDKTVERLPAAVSEFKELSSDVSRTLNILWNSCPDKLGELMQNANAVGKVWYGEQNPENGSKLPTVWSWRITSVYRTPPPSFQEKTIATLKIDWTSAAQTGFAADRGPSWQKTCTIEKN